jgi:hypothetical protein
MTELQSVTVEEDGVKTVAEMNRDELRELLSKADRSMMHALGPIRRSQELLAKKGDQLGFEDEELVKLTKALDHLFVRASHLANRVIGKEIIEDILMPYEEASA